jgi:heme-degrading monooxygenase HmoA
LKVSQFFEVDIKEGLRDRYMELAASLRPGMDAMGGCLFIDRFRSLTRANTLLSYQIWQDEASMTAWRSDGYHHSIQTVGREQIFSDYRIRIAQVVYETTANGSIWKPERLTPYNDPARQAPKFVIASESTSASLPIATDWVRDSFASMYREGQFAHVVDLPDYESGLKFGAQLFSDPSTEYFRIFEVIRDYGMYDRREAPQYYPPVPASS